MLCSDLVELCEKADENQSVGAWIDLFDEFLCLIWVEFGKARCFLSFFFFYSSWVKSFAFPSIWCPE